MNNFVKSLIGVLAASVLFVFVLWALSGFGDRPRRTDDGVVLQHLHLGNGTEPEDIDTHITTGVQEHFIQMALIEGLVSEDPKDLTPVPGVAESWDISEDGRVYTFHLRENAKWSNGETITAEDFVLSYKRGLSARLANEYAYMFFYVVNAEEYYTGEITDFDEVGFKAIDDRTLEITLKASTPYFLSVLNHHSWYPVHVPTILKHGEFDDRRNTWTRPGNFVGNGPFVLDEWKINNVLTVVKNPLYWDAERVRLEKIFFYPIESLDTEERAFRVGQIHKTNKLPLSKIPVYAEQNAPQLMNTPYLGVYHYMFNTSLPGLDDPRVRKALNLAIDRRAIVKNVTQGGEEPAFSFVPPNCAGYTSKYSIDLNIAEAKRLMAEAGYPDGRGFPEYSILYNTLESHKTIAEAVQQMWKNNLGINVKLENQEWKVYLNSKTEGDFDIVRFGWIGDYVDPTTFLHLYLADGGNNNSNWGSEKYDDLLEQAGRTADPDARYALLQEAEGVLLDELPIMPIYYYMTSYLLDTRVKGWYPTILDHHPYKYVYIEEE